MEVIIRIPPFFLATWIFRRQLANRLSAWKQLSARAREQGYAGLEIHDRKIQRLPAAEADALLSHIRSQGLEVILGLDTEFSRSDPVTQNGEIRRAAERIQWARDRGITRLRLTTGGQTISLARLIKQVQPYSSRLSQVLETVLNRPLIMKPVRLAKARLRRPVSKPALERIISALKGLLPTAERCGVLLALENHWGASSDWRDLKTIVTAVNSPRLGICLDWGNFPSREEILSGVTGLLPWVRHMHAKSYSFDPNGEETTLPYGEIIRLVRGSPYAGALTVEYEGEGDPWEGSRLTRERIRRGYREGPG